MSYREALLNEQYPKLSSDEAFRFSKELIKLEEVAVGMYKGQLTEHATQQSMYGHYYLWGWKWPALYFMWVRKEERNPEPDFITFVHDTVKRLGLMEKKETPIKE